MMPDRAQGDGGTGEANQGRAAQLATMEIAARGAIRWIEGRNTAADDCLAQWRSTEERVMTEMIANSIAEAYGGGD